MTLDPEKLADRDFALICEACEHLAQCWDALSAVECRHGDNNAIDTEDITGLAADLGFPANGKSLADDEIREHLRDRFEQADSRRLRQSNVC